MAKDKFDREHDREMVSISKKLGQLFYEMARGIGAASSLATIDPSVPFRLSDHPLLEKKVEKILVSLSQRVDTVVLEGIRSGWTLANKKNDELCRTVFGHRINSLTKEQRRFYFSNNESALQAFIERKVNGMDLSRRVWKYIGSTRDSLEKAIELGLKTGESASEIARDINSYLQYPDKLFRRVRDEEGRLHLSKSSAAFHPGQGVYRSSYKNAMRLARTENNIAYRTSDHTRHGQLNFIVGIEVHLSGNHTCIGPDGKPHPFHDICDDLQGKYPKWFKFTGWHPQCRCFTTTILKTPEEVRRDMDGIDRGSVNAVKDVPPQFKNWLEDNADRIAGAEERDTLPYFLRDNMWAWKEGYELPTKKDPREIAIELHAKRTPEEIQAIKDRWAERKAAFAEGGGMLSRLDGVLFTDDLKWALESGNPANVRVAMAALKKQEDKLLDEFKVLADPYSAIRKFGVEEIRKVVPRIENTIADKIDSKRDLKDKIEAAEFEAKYIKEHGTKYPTWEVAYDAYMKKKKVLEEEKIWGDIDRKTDTIMSSTLFSRISSAISEGVRKIKERSYAPEAAKILLETANSQIRAVEKYDYLKDFLRAHPRLMGESFADNVEKWFSEWNKDELEDLEHVAGRKLRDFNDMKKDAIGHINAGGVTESTEKAIREAIANEDFDALKFLERKADKERKVAEQLDFINETVAKHPKLFSHLMGDVEKARETRDENKVWITYSQVVTLNGQFTNAVNEMTVYMNGGHLLPDTLEKARKAIDDESYWDLVSLISQAKEEYEFGVALDELEEYINNPISVAKINAIGIYKNGSFDVMDAVNSATSSRSASVVRTISTVCEDYLDEFEGLEKQIQDAWSYTDASKKYKALADEAEAALDALDVKLFKDKYSELQEEKRKIEEGKAYRAKVDAEFEAIGKKLEMAKGKANNVSNNELDALIASLDKSYTSRKLRESRKALAAVLDKFESLGIVLNEQRGAIMGESVADLRNRLGANCPKTVEVLDKCMDRRRFGFTGYLSPEDYAKRKASGVALPSDVLSEEEYNNLKNNMKRLFEYHDYGMQVQSKRVGAILDSWFKNQFENGDGNGYVSSVGDISKEHNIPTGHSRLTFTHEIFLNGKSTSGSNQLLRKEYEKYGHLVDRDVIKDFRVYNGASGYGDVIFKFKKDSVVCTFTQNDSLGKCFQPSLVTDPEPCSWGSRAKMRGEMPLDKDWSIEDMGRIRSDFSTSYVELQYHGELTCECVESINFPYDINMSSFKSAANKAVAMGIKVFHIPGKGRGASIKASDKMVEYKP